MADSQIGLSLPLTHNQGARGGENGTTRPRDHYSASTEALD